MNILDDLKGISSLDPKRTLESIAFLPDQCEAAWTQAKKVVFPIGYTNIHSILFTGMGGSAYGARIIKSLYGLEMKIPIDLVSDYHVPSYVNENTLVVAASYSGTTEETINCAKEALAKNAKIVGISSGGPLFDLLQASQKPFFRFDPVYNPSAQPRIGQGYMQIGLMALLHTLGLIPILETDVIHMIAELRIQAAHLSETVDSTQNEAKQLALQFENKVVNLIAAEFLEGAVHAIRNPFHETGKHMASYAIVPELNHHLMEGLSYPKSIKNDFLYVLIRCSLYSDVIQKRMELTKEVIEKNNIGVIDIELKSASKLACVFELIQLGSFVTFYLAMLHGIDPSKIPWVDYFKKKLQ